MSKLAELEDFMRLLHAVQNVERVARIPDETKRRTTAEHTFELALAAWFIAARNKLGLSLEKLLKYALAHDLVEGYAGDTFICDPEAMKSKAAREAAAVAQIEKEFAHFPDLLATIHAYEARDDAESVFVYAVDKLMDPVNVGMETTSSLWKELGVTYAQERELKDAKIQLSPIVQKYWEELCAKYEANKDFYFAE